MLVTHHPGCEWLCELSQLFADTDLVFLDSRKSQWVGIVEYDDAYEAFVRAAL